MNKFVIVVYLLFFLTSAAVAENVNLHWLSDGACYIDGPIGINELKEKLKREKIYHLEIRGKLVKVNVLEDPRIFPDLERIVLSSTNSEVFIPELNKYSRLNKVVIEQDEELNCYFLNHLKSLHNLKSLTLGCPLTKTDALKNSFPTSIKELTLINTNLSDSALSSLPELKFLTSLNIVGGIMKGSFLQHFIAPSLRSLFLSDLNLNEDFLEFLARFPIKSLELAGKDISLSSKGLKSIGALQFLNSLTMLQVVLDVNSVHYLCAAKKLNSIYVGLPNLDDLFLEQLRNCNALTAVRTWSTFSEKALSRFKMQHPKCMVGDMKPQN